MHVCHIGNDTAAKRVAQAKERTGHFGAEDIGKVQQIARMVEPRSYAQSSDIVTAAGSQKKEWHGVWLTFAAELVLVQDAALALPGSVGYPYGTHTHALAATGVHKILPQRFIQLLWVGPESAKGERRGV